jgi:DUF1365 family protein
MELYSGVVSHKRWLPKSHAFSYEVCLVLLDLGRLQAATAGLWPLVGLNCSAVASFHEADHMKGFRRPGQSLSEAVHSALAERVPGYRPPQGCRVLLLTHLRYFGYCFNPISLYYVLNAAGCVDCILAEVSNTPWNEMHLYALHPGATGVGASREARMPSRSALQQGLRSSASSSSSASSASSSSAFIHVPLPLSSAGQSTLAQQGGVAPMDFELLAQRFAGSSSSSRGRGSSAAAAAAAAASGSRGSSARSSSRGRSSSAAKGASAASPGTSSSSSSLQQLAPGAAGSSAREDLLRFSWAKNFHVSPFFGMDHTYEWLFSQPCWQQEQQEQQEQQLGSSSSSSSTSREPTLLVQSRNLLPSGDTVLSVQLLLERKAGAASRLFWLYILFWAFPFLTFRVQIWIHVEALRLWLFKGAQYFPHPTSTTIWKKSA